MDNIIVSACLLGRGCRYDGVSKPPCEAVLKLKEKFNLIPVCAEDLGGLPTPRTSAEIVGDKVIRKDGVDVTYEYETGAKKVLDIAIKYGCRAAVLKSKSPSCGHGRIYDGTFTKTLTEGNGKCAALLIKNGIEVFDETETEQLIKYYEDNSN